MSKDFMIEENLLPVTIRTIKIGKKNLTEKLINQIPWGKDFVYHIEDSRTHYGLNYEYTNEYTLGKLGDKKHKYVIDENFEIDGTIIGYIESNIIKIGPSIKEKIDQLKEMEYFPNKETYYKMYFILWYDKDNMLRKGIIDEWTISMAKIKLEKIWL